MTESAARRSHTVVLNESHPLLDDLPPIDINTRTLLTRLGLSLAAAEVFVESPDRHLVRTKMNQILDMVHPTPDDLPECRVNIFREQMSARSALDEYLDVKRREFIGASGDEIGAADALRLRDDLGGLDRRIERQLVAGGRTSVSYLVMGRVQSGKTGHQLGMLAWAADKCDVAVIFTGVTEALNGQTSYRISKDLGTLPSNPIATLNVPTRASAERDQSFLESVLRRTKQRRDYRAGEGMWPERLPILVSMKTRPRVDALKWMFQEVSSRLGEGVTALIIDDEADQASPNAAARKNEEAATYAELKALRDAATHHVWLSYTATPQAIFLTERDGALRPDFCAVSRPGSGYFGVGSTHGRYSSTRPCSHP